MRYQAFVRAAAVVLSATVFSSGAVLAQRTTTAPRALPPGHTVTDVQPLPADDRSSLGAVVLMDDPVLAQRDEMLQARSREPDTRTMGAAARVLQKALTREELDAKRAQDAAERQRGGPVAR